MHKYSFTQTHVYFFLGVLSMLALIGGLCSEYTAVHRQTQELIHLKNQYQEYVAVYKELLSGWHSEHDARILCQSGLQGVDEDAAECGDFFDVVNRDFIYLKNAAVHYAKLHDVERLTKSVYESSGLTQERSVRNSSSHAALHSKRTARVSTYRDEFTCSWPIESGRFWISSKFGVRKKKNGTTEFHNGLDMAAITGTPVAASAAGTVTEVRYAAQGFGKTVVITHQRGYTTRYAHLDSIAVKVGQTMRSGMLVGTVGSTGSVRGINGSRNASHLHLEVLRNGERIDPLLVLA